jgi:hypothetical protein
LRHLLSLKLVDSSFAGLLAAYRKLQGAQEEEGKTGEGSSALQTVCPYHARSLHWADAKLPEGARTLAISSEEAEVAEAALASARRTAVVDDFLSPAAFAALRAFVLSSFIFFSPSSQGGFVGSYMNEGFNASLLHQIAAELKRTLPTAFAGLDLLEAWCYKVVPGSRLPI